MSTRVAVLSDTHLRAGDGKKMSSRTYEQLELADVILHAGDILDESVLRDIRKYAPVHAVLGNNDVTMIGALPERLSVEIEGVRIAMVHDSGAREGRARRMREWFPDADLVVFGHSHQPMNEVGLEGQILFNPGSAVQRRKEPHHTMGMLELSDGKIVRREIVIVDDE